MDIWTIKIKILRFCRSISQLIIVECLKEQCKSEKQIKEISRRVIKILLWELMVWTMRVGVCFFFFQSNNLN